MTPPTPGYEGSWQQYDCIVEYDVAVVMADGVTLYMDLYRPALAGEALPGPWPVLLERGPYNKDRLLYTLNGRYFAKRGYVYAIQDVRGRWMSEGRFEFLRNEADDGRDTVAWIADQPWCEQVGTLGISYTTATQQALAVRQTKFLSFWTQWKFLRLGSTYFCSKYFSSFSMPFTVSSAIRALSPADWLMR